MEAEPQALRACDRVVRLQRLAHTEREVATPLHEEGRCLDALQRRDRRSLGRERVRGRELTRVGRVAHSEDGRCDAFGRDRGGEAGDRAGLREALWEKRGPEIRK